MSFCLLPKQVDDFLAKLRDGTIDPEKLSNMSSEERHKFLSGIVGEGNAIQTNALFESKLLLKDQQKGLVTWAKKVSGISEPARRDIISRIQKMEVPLSPKDEQGFLKDLVDTKLGVNVTSDEAKRIMELSKNIEGASKTIDKNGISPFGRATQELMSYIQEKTPGKKGTIEVLANISSIQRAVQTGFDISAIGRQGAAYFGRSEWFGAVRRMAGYIKSEKNMDELAMKMYSDKNWDIISRFRKQLGLTNLGEKMTQREEQFASKLIKKIPGLNISERAYTGFLSDLRYHRFTNTINILEKRGIPMNDEALKALAETIGASTGRGQLGMVEPAANALATTMFSPRWFASKIQIVTNPITKTGPARAEAIKALGTLAGISTSLILGIKASGGSIEIDPRSSDFGKLKVGNTRIDLTFGQGQYIRALTQIVTGVTKSTTTGEIKKLSTGEFGARTRLDVASDFLKGKAAPNVSLLLDFLEGQDWSGNKLGIDLKNIKSEKNVDALARVLNMFMPLVGNDALDAYYEASGNNAEGIKRALTAFGLSEIGIGVQTYSNKQNIIKNLGVDQRNIIEKALNLPARPSVEYKSLIDKLIKEKINISIPGSATTIKPANSKNSRPMTDRELSIYQIIYQKNLRNNLSRYNNSILKLTGRELDKIIDSIKRNTTEQSKIELLKQLRF